MSDNKIPALMPSRGDIVIDDLRHHRRLFSDDRWTVKWRSATVPDVRGESRFSCSDEAGVGHIAGEEFTFAVSWKYDRRRGSLSADLLGSARVVFDTLASR